MIPENITREHVLAAIRDVDADGVPGTHETTVDFLVHGGRRYPSKLLVTKAAGHATGGELEGMQFDGPDANRFLAERGFEIVVDGDRAAPGARASVHSVQRTFDRIVPDRELRRLCAEILAIGIDEGHAVSPATWQLSLKPKLLRLNCGQQLVCDVTPTYILLGLDPSELSAPAKRALRSKATESGSFHKIPEMTTYRVPLDAVAQLWPSLEAAYRSNVQAAARTARRSTWARAHQPALVDYLEQLVERSLPRPDYSDPPTDAKMSTAEEAVTSTTDAFDALMESLAEGNLSFPDQVVSHYLLALQTKRFVILTGISGTGKTQLALAVARHFPYATTRARAVDPPADAALIRVSPYMLKYRGFVVPAAVAAGLRLPNLTGTGSDLVEVSYPGGTAELSVYRDIRGTHTVHRLGFKGASADWFRSNLEVGDELFLETLEPAPSGRDRLRLTLPSKVDEVVSAKNYEVIAVRPDWTDSRGLLGFYNPLTRRYATTPFLSLVLAATRENELAKEAKRSPHPYFVVLDEMNLARVEQYFSDFLSAMESGEPVHLHDDETVESGDFEDEDESATPVPRQLVIPPNLFFTGTVNVDETTYMFSPKVLDRSFVIEFNDVNLATYGAEADAHASHLRLSRWEALTPGERLSSKDWEALTDYDDQVDARAALLRLNEILADENRHFGYRVANEIGRFLSLASEYTETEDAKLTALDLAVMSKVLPKLHGTQQELEPMLLRLFAFAAGDQLAEVAPEDWDHVSGSLVTRTGAESPWLPRSGLKLWRMLRRLRLLGFTSFIE